MKKSFRRKKFKFSSFVKTAEINASLDVLKSYGIFYIGRGQYWVRKKGLVSGHDVLAYLP
jgi:hypothetical protein